MEDQENDSEQGNPRILRSHCVQVGSYHSHLAFPVFTAVILYVRDTNPIAAIRLKVNKLIYSQDN